MLFFENYVCPLSVRNRYLKIAVNLFKKNQQIEMPYDKIQYYFECLFTVL